ncbi:Phosphodiesterase [Caligus rogercresseyi]|uniref:Phosphodiesterase n=1 Tax=Caligus rogercresseyi TaxID=217165 RepID=A0A7T8GPU4_CALRO|nr:Phosphodiesterase [Caligus rogercresseyi]
MFVMLERTGWKTEFLTDSPLSALYENSILENYHIERTLYLLNHPHNNILKNLSDATHLITQRILDTDLALYFKEAPRIKKASFSGQERLPENKPLVMSALMTAADLNMASKPWEVYSQVSGLLAQEFWAQGDMERDLGLVPEPLMDRELSHLFPNMQIDFLDKVCIPVMEIVSRFHSGLSPLVNNAMQNKEKWVALACCSEAPEP